MKQLRKSDLKLGEIYWFVGSNIKFLNKISNINIDEYDCYLYNTTYFAGKGKNLKNPVNILEATPEEKHWLETCIKADKFVSYEEAMRTFIPEYVECVYSCNNRFIENKIYKVLEYSNIDEPRVTIDNHSYYKHLPFNGDSWKFKPSTKEAYDAQFVVKDPEFVLPEKWCIKFSHDKKLLDWCKENTQTNFTYFENLIITNDNYFHYPLNTTQVITRNSNYTEITFEQFKKYVLKEEIVEVLKEPKDKVLKLNTLKQISQVESSEGGVFQIGDKITPFDKNSPNKGKPFTITGFRWNNAKTEICAGTELHRPYGIRLSQIELYVEPKKRIQSFRRS